MADRSYYKECGGSRNICEHSRQKRYCKECRWVYVSMANKLIKRSLEAVKNLCEHGKVQGE
jgi:hypothetical protein